MTASSSQLPAGDASFSWRRVWLFGRLFGRAVGAQAVIYACIYAAFAVVISCIGIKSSVFNPLNLLFGTLLTLMVYFIPLPLRWARSEQAILYPASPTEKFIFLCGYSLAICPLFLCLLSSAYYGLGSLLAGTNLYFYSMNTQSIYAEQIMNMVRDNRLYFLLMMAIGTIWNAFIVVANLGIVLLQKRHAAIKCLIVPISASLFLGLIFGVMGIAIGFYSGYVGGQFILDTLQFIRFTLVCVGVSAALALVAIIFVIRWLYRRYTRMNVC